MSAEATAGGSLLAAQMQGLFEAMNGNSWVSGLTVTEDTGSNMNIIITDGVVTVADAEVIVSSETITIGTSDPTSDRIDVLTVDSGGNLNITEGTPAEATEGVQGETLIAIIRVGAAATAITDADITDGRYDLSGIIPPRTIGANTQTTLGSGSSAGASDWNHTLPEFLPIGSDGVGGVPGLLVTPTEGEPCAVSIGGTAGAMGAIEDLSDADLQFFVERVSLHGRGQTLSTSNKLDTAYFSWGWGFIEVNDDVSDTADLREAFHKTESNRTPFTGIWYGFDDTEGAQRIVDGVYDSTFAEAPEEIGLCHGQLLSNSLEIVAHHYDTGLSQDTVEDSNIPTFGPNVRLVVFSNMRGEALRFDIVAIDGEPSPLTP